MNNLHLTRGHVLSTSIVASAERLQSLFVHARFHKTHCNRTIHVPNKYKTSIVKPTNIVECATHLSCSQLFHTCLHRHIGSCGGGEFHDGTG